jgi:hypothetical protein
LIVTTRSVSELRVTARLGGVSGLAAVLVCLGCTAPAAHESRDPSAPLAASSTQSAIPATASTASPTAEPSVTAAPTVGPSAVTEFGFSDILRVEVNGLAVRVSPTLNSPLAQGIERPGDVRLDAGDYVSVELGPLPAGDVVWYLVWPAEDARLNYSTVSWDINGDDPAGGVNPGWVAASVGEDQYLTLHRSPDPSEYESWPAGGPMTLMMSGSGDYVSEPLVQHDLFDFDWAAVVHDEAAPCSFSVTLLPEGGAESIVVLETSVSDVEQGPVAGEAGLVDVPWDASAGDAGDALFTLSVRSRCAWTLKLTPLAHD